MPKYAPYAWIIDVDYGYDEDSAYYEELDIKSRVGLTGPRNIDPELESMLRANDPKINKKCYVFQLRSDDMDEADHKDYKGRLIYREGYEGDQFEPFDDFHADVGSTAIFYREGRKWVML